MSWAATRRPVPHMSRIAGLLGVFAVFLLYVVFAALNGSQRVTVDLWLVAFHRVPLTFVVFGGLFAGMLVMLIAGVQSDLKVRAILRQRLETENREEQALIDLAQQELFPLEPIESADGEERAPSRE